MELAVDRGHQERISAHAGPSFARSARARARVLSRSMAFWALVRMQRGYPRSQRPVGAGNRMGTAIALMLLAQCSPERQVLFGDAEAPLGPAGSSVDSVGGTGGSPG